MKNYEPGTEPDTAMIKLAAQLITGLIIRPDAISRNWVAVVQSIALAPIAVSALLMPVHAAQALATDAQCQNYQLVDVADDEKTNDNSGPTTLEKQSAVANRALIMAATTGDARLATFALERGADAGARDDSEDQTPALILATRSRSKDIVVKLLEKDVSPDIRSKTGLTALMQAARTSQTEIAEILLEAGAQIDLHDLRDGYTALLHTASAGNLAMLELLIESGSNVSVAEQTRGLTALMLAASRRTGFQMVIDLIAAGADINTTATDGWTALMAATDQKNHDALEVLLLNGADPLARTDDGRTAISLAARSGALDAISLLTASIDVDDSMQLLGESLHEAALRGNQAVAEHLLTIGANPNSRNAAGASVLHSAVLGGHENLVQTLLTHGADPNLSTNDDGHTALMLAANRDMLNAVRYLLTAGADTSIVASDGWTAMEAAEMVGATDIITELNLHSSN